MQIAEAITQIPAPSPKMKGKLLMFLKRDINWEIKLFDFLKWL
jgi:hypothetical protein